MQADTHGLVARAAARACVVAAPIAAALAVKGGALSATSTRGRAAVRALGTAAAVSLGGLVEERVCIMACVCWKRGCVVGREGRGGQKPEGASIPTRGKTARTLDAASLSPLQTSYAAALAGPVHRLATCDVSAVLTALLSLAAALLASQSALAAASHAPAAVARRGRRVSRRAATTGLLIFGGFWALASTCFAVAATLDAGLTPAGRAARAAAAVACAAAATATTHGLVGPSLHGVRDWKFVAPLQGGGAAIALQAGAWGVTGVSTLALARFAFAASAATTAAVATALAASPLLAQLLLVASLLAWRTGGGGKGARNSARARARPPPPRPRARA